MTVQLLLWIVGIVVPLFHILGVLSAVRAIMDTRTAQGAVAWVISLITFPYLALPLYWVFGRTRFRGYEETLKSHRFREVVHRTQIVEIMKTYRTDLATSEQERFLAFEHLTPLSFVHANRVELLVDGEATFDAIFAAIDAAQSYVLLQFFIVKDDEIGRALKDRLAARARDGIAIYFVYDEIGSLGLARGYIEGLQALGVRMLPFHTTKGYANRFQLNFRNHRKIVVVDGRVAFTGGLNVGDEYMGRSKIARLRPWRDTMIRVEGPAVIQLQALWAVDWLWASGEVPDLRWKPEAAAGSNQTAIILPTGPATELETCSLFFSSAIHSARKRIWIASPYFVPDHAVQSALVLAALRRVDVRIILPASADHWLAWFARYTFLPTTDRLGIKLYLRSPGFMHQKVVLIDDEAAAIGTANLDSRSLRLNFEVMALVVDSPFAAQVEAMLEQDIAKSRRIYEEEFTKRSFWFRLAARSARLLDPIL